MYGTIKPYTTWEKYKNKFGLCRADSNGLKMCSGCQFTESEFKDLINYMKTLPDGEFQAKVAEHGKRLVEETDK